MKYLEIKNVDLILKLYKFHGPKYCSINQADVGKFYVISW